MDTLRREWETQQAKAKGRLPPHARFLTPKTLPIGITVLNFIGNGQHKDDSNHGSTSCNSSSGIDILNHDSSSCCSMGSSTCTRDIEIDVVGDEEEDDDDCDDIDSDFERERRQPPNDVSIDLTTTSVNKNRRLNPFSIESLLSSNSGLSVSMIPTSNSITSNNNNLNVNNNDRNSEIDHIENANSPSRCDNSTQNKNSDKNTNQYKNTIGGSYSSDKKSDSVQTNLSLNHFNFNGHFMNSNSKNENDNT